MRYSNVGDFKDPLKQNLGLGFCRNQNKDFSILTETHINLDQIHHIRNNWLGPILFSPEIVTLKKCFSCLIWVWEIVTEVDTDPKRRFVSFKVTPSNERVLCVFTLHGITPDNRWLGGISLKDYTITWKIKVRKMKTK